MDATEVKPRRQPAQALSVEDNVESKAGCKRDRAKKSSSSFPDQAIGKLELVPFSTLMVMLVVFFFFAGGGNRLFHRHGSQGGFFSSTNEEKDELLGKLLAPGSDVKSCQSRYQSVLYRKESPHLPSPYLVKKLREYENLHQRCGPNTALYQKSMAQLKSNRSSRATDCNYLIWTPNSGLGNRMITLVSALLYSLLTDRVLLIQRGSDVDTLFCEPFPNSSWLLDSDISLGHLIGFYQGSPQSYGKLLQTGRTSKKGFAQADGWLPTFLYLHLTHDYRLDDQKFFCDEDQLFLQKIPWLVMNSNIYFAPSFFLMPAFQQELSRLFPEPDTVFHHLGRYLFHPSNQVWGLITRFYQTHLNKFDHKVGIQIRVFDRHQSAFLKKGINTVQQVTDQILSCAAKEKLLPEIPQIKETTPETSNRRSTAILVTSLNSEYADKIKNMYWEQSAAGGEIVGVYQPSHEEFQQSEKITHNMKACAEIYLLSFSDVLITSSQSTFGYAAQGLGGLEPWILDRPDSETAKEKPCQRAISMEPCFHATPQHDCKSKRVDLGSLVPHLKHCEDVPDAIKLVKVIPRL